MKLKKVVFRLDKIFTEEQEVFFEDENICLIGANASGKSTVLMVLFQIFQKRRHLRNNYFKILDSKVEFLLSNDEKKELFYSTDIIDPDVTITMLNAHTIDNQFVSELIYKELDFIYGKLMELKTEYIKLLNQLKTEIISFENQNNVDYLFKNVSRAWIVDDKYVQDVFDLIEELREHITNTISQKRELKNNYHRFSEHNSVFYQPRSINDWNLTELHNYFSDCRTEGESIYVKLCKEFELKNNELFQKIRNTGIEANRLIEHFQFIVKGDSYQNLYSYLDKLVTSSAELIDNTDVYNLSKTVFDIMLRKNYSPIYSSIYSMYEQELDNEMDFEFFKHLYELKLLKKDYNSFGSMFDNQDDLNEDTYKDTDEYLFLSDKSKVLENLKIYLTNKDIVSDFNEDFSFTIFKIDTQLITDNIESQLLDYVPDFDGDIVDGFQIDSDLNIYVNENGSSFKIEELSQGRKWALRLNLLLSVLRDNQLILIDEPAMNLHERAQREMLNKFLSIQNQIVYCTHSPTLLPIAIENVGIYDIQKDKESSILVNINQRVEDGIIESFDMKFLQNIIVDRKRNVILLQDDLESDFTDLCEENQVYIDFVVCPVEYNPKLFINLDKIFWKYQFKSFYLINSVKKKQKLINANLKNVFEYSELVEIITNNIDAIELGLLIGCDNHES